VFFVHHLALSVLPKFSFLKPIHHLHVLLSLRDSFNGGGQFQFCLFLLLSVFPKLLLTVSHRGHNGLHQSGRTADSEILSRHLREFLNFTFCLLHLLIGFVFLSLTDGRGKSSQFFGLFAHTMQRFDSGMKSFHG